MSTLYRHDSLRSVLIIPAIMAALMLSPLAALAQDEAVESTDDTSEAGDDTSNKSGTPEGGEEQDSESESPDPLAPQEAAVSEDSGEPTSTEESDGSTEEADANPASGDADTGAEREAHVDAEPATKVAPASDTKETPEAKAAPAEEKKVNPLQSPELLLRFKKMPVANGMNLYKPGTGLTLTSKNGAFSLATRLRVQLRYQVTGAEGTPEHVFQIRRARVQFKGHAFNKHNKFKIELAFSPRDLSMKNGVPHRTPLLTWYLEFDYLRDLTVRVGQYKIPYSRQRVVSSGDLQLVDRSIANGEFNHDRDIGFDIRSKDLGGLGGRLRYYLGVYMGEGRDFGDKNATPDFKLHYLGRFEILPFGKFKDYKEADMARNLEPKLAIGAAYSFHHGSQGLRGVLGTTPEDGGTTDYHSMNVDYVFKFGGFSSTGEFHLRNGTRNPGEESAVVTPARNGLGWAVQAGFMIPRLPIEVAARYSGIRPLGDETSLSANNAVGGGLSWYPGGHPWKIQADYFHTWDDDEETPGDHAFRMQLQLAF